MKPRMTFSDFQATGRDCADIGAHADVRDSSLAGCAGRVYHGGLFVEAPRAVGEGWYLCIGNCEWLGGLADCERYLYEWGCDEGYMVRTFADATRVGPSADWVNETFSFGRGVHVFDEENGQWSVVIRDGVDEDGNARDACVATFDTSTEAAERARALVAERAGGAS